MYIIDEAATIPENCVPKGINENGTLLVVRVTEISICLTLKTS